MKSPSAQRLSLPLETGMVIGPILGLNERIYIRGSKWFLLHRGCSVSCDLVFCVVAFPPLKQHVDEHTCALVGLAHVSMCVSVWSWRDPCRSAGHARVMPGERKGVPGWSLPGAHPLCASRALRPTSSTKAPSPGSSVRTAPVAWTAAGRTACPRATSSTRARRATSCPTRVSAIVNSLAGLGGAAFFLPIRRFFGA